MLTNFEQTGSAENNCNTNYAKSKTLTGAFSRWFRDPNK